MMSDEKSLSLLEIQLLRVLFSKAERLALLNREIYAVRKAIEVRVLMKLDECEHLRKELGGVKAELANALQGTFF